MFHLQPRPQQCQFFFFFLSNQHFNTGFPVTSQPNLSGQAFLAYSRGKEDENYFIYMQPVGVFCSYVFFLEEEVVLAQLLFF